MISVIMRSPLFCAIKAFENRTKNWSLAPDYGNTAKWFAWDITKQPKQGKQTMPMSSLPII
jgi:hypothetical protein